MDSEPDLRTADRETLLAVIGELQATVEQRIDALEAQLRGGGKRGMPGNKPSSPPQPMEKQPSKKRDSGFGRLRMTPTERVEHALDNCPDCGTPLAGGWVQRTREVIEIPIGPTEHAFVTRVCSRCKRRQMSQGRYQEWLRASNASGPTWSAWSRPWGRPAVADSGYPTEPPASGDQPQD